MNLHSAILAAGVAIMVPAGGEPERVPRQGIGAELLVLDLDGNGFCFTSVGSGVVVRTRPRENPGRIAWTCARNPDAFVVVDTTRNGRIDGFWEMVGSALGISNGFEYLRRMDGRVNESGGQKAADGRLDAGDEAFRRLILWTDQNHNGVSEEDELQSAAYAGVTAFLLETTLVRDADAHGNVVTQRGAATLMRAGKQIQRGLVTVRLGVQVSQWARPD